VALCPDPRAPIPPPVGFVPLALAGSADFNPGLLGKHAHAPQIDFTPYAYARQSRARSDAVGPIGDFSPSAKQSGHTDPEGSAVVHRWIGTCSVAGELGKLYECERPWSVRRQTTSYWPSRKCVIYAADTTGQMLPDSSQVPDCIQRLFIHPKVITHLSTNWACCS